MSLRIAFGLAPVSISAFTTAGLFPSAAAVKRGFADTVAGIRVRFGLYQRIDGQEISPERRRIEQVPRRIRRPRLAFASRQPGDNDRQGECRYAGPVYSCDNSFNASIT